MGSRLLFRRQVDDVGLLVRLERVSRRMRQDDLAALAGVLPQQVSALERGAYLHPAARRRILAAVGLEENLAQQEGLAP